VGLFIRYPLLQIESEGFQLETIFGYASTK
jgi:hypothetical protein